MFDLACTQPTACLTAALNALNAPILLASLAGLTLQTSFAEGLGFALALSMVYFNMRQEHWGWWCALLSSALYFWVFAGAKLYAEAGLQVVFAVLAVWGGLKWLGWLGRLGTLGLKVPVPAVSPLIQTQSLWSKLLHAKPSEGPKGAIRNITPQVALSSAALGAVVWLALAQLLQRFTDSELPHLDALLTSASLVATVWTAQKYVQNWPLWLAVNVLSCGVFAYKNLALTALLYALLGVLACVGWRRWHSELKEPSANAAV